MQRITNWTGTQTETGSGERHCGY